MLRTLLLIFGFAGGWFCPWLAALKPLMAVFLAYMLTVVFLRMRVTRETLTTRHWCILVTNLLLPVALWKGMLLCGIPERFAQAAFFTAVTPTAAAAPVIVNLLGGSISFATVGFLLSTLCMSAALPFLIPPVLHRPVWGELPAALTNGSLSIWESCGTFLTWLGDQPAGLILGRVFFVTLLPMVFAVLLRRKFGERARNWGNRLTASTLYVWVGLVAIIASSASQSLKEHTAAYPASDIWWVLLIDIVLCVGMFALGALLGRPKHLRECSQLLGQKNTSYTTYLAFACDAPFAALGPAFYVFFHNTWNGLQLIFHKEKPQDQE
jgi:BASS family bile acid:Na+ symporter